MKRTTHIMLGAAVALPTAVSAPPLVAFGCLWWGMAGGGAPDWFDLRSEWRSTFRLRHRGVSHSALFLASATIFVWCVGLVFQRSAFTVGSVDLRPTDATIGMWTLCGALGVLSHLLGDACTHAGIQPFLPLAKTRLWVLPRALRGRSDGPLDGVARLLAAAVIALMAVQEVTTRL